MFQSLEIFQTSASMARHAARSQAVVAENLANSDTPGFRAKEVQAFKPGRMDASANSSLRTSRAGHISPARDHIASLVSQVENAPQSPNGNSVQIETEILNSIEAERAHSRALSIYKSALDLLRAGISRR